MIHHRLRGVTGEVTSTIWRLLGNGLTYDTSVGTYGQAIYEIRFYESVDASGTNVNIGATVSATELNFPGANAIDNSLVTYWQNNNSNAAADTYFQLTYGAAKTIRSVQFALFTAGYHQRSYLLQAYVNSAWVNVATLNLLETTATQTFTNLQ